MPYSLETLAALATILGAAISVLALLQSRAWLVLTSLFFVGLAIAAGYYARRERLVRDGASTVIEGYSIDSGAGTSFQELDCVAYDLGHDPDMLRVIHPLLVGPEGISKKISVPFLEPLKANQSFGVLHASRQSAC